MLLYILFLFTTFSLSSCEDALISEEQLADSFGFLQQAVYKIWEKSIDIVDLIPLPAGFKKLALESSSSSTLDRKVQEHYITKGQTWHWVHEPDPMRFWNMSFWYNELQGDITHRLWSSRYVNITIDGISPPIKPWHYVSMSISRLKKKGCIRANKTTLAWNTWHQFWNHDYTGFEYSPFEGMCLDIATHANCKIIVEETTVKQLRYPIRLLIGTLLTLVAPYMAESILCSMLTGGLIGGILAYFVAAYVIYRLFLKDSGPMGSALFIIPAATTVYGFNEMWNFASVGDFLVVHWYLTYFMIFGFVLAAIYIYIHPPSDRSQDVISVLLRLIGLSFVAYSTSSNAVSMALVVVVAVIALILKGLGQDSAV